jgi:hypothetical protein
MAKQNTGPSTRNLDALPPPARLRALSQSIALLDEILCDDWDGRYYSFDPKWGAGEEVASMRNGSGDDWFLWFSKPGLVLLGFDHEAAPMTPYARKDHSLWPGLLDGFPRELRAALDEPAFTPADLTFCIWRAAGDDRYRIGNLEFPQRDAVEPFASDPDGSAALLQIFDDDPRSYASFAREYYEVDVDLAAVKRIYAHAALDAATVRALSADADFEGIAESASAMGFAISRKT